MNKEQLHLLGIKAVYKHLVDDGWEVLNVRQEIDINPQILARQNGEMIMIVVKTAVYPRMGVLFPEVAAQIKEHAKKHNAQALFASIGIANANGDTDKEMAQPVVGGEYYINFNGLQPFPF